MVTVIVDGELLLPEMAGPGALVLAGGKIEAIQAVDVAAVTRAFPDAQVVSAAGSYLCPGIIDPHQHLIGGSGEDGFATKGPEIALSEILLAGITTVVGTLGADTTMRTMPALLGKVKALRDESLTAFLYTGGYPVPPATLTGSVKTDLLFVDEVIGLGELAVSDRRGSGYDLAEIAKLVHDAYVAGTLSRKAGVTHFHLGDGKSGMTVVSRLLDDFEVPTSTVYPTHISRNPRLLGEAAEISRRGVTVDMDTVDRDLSPSLQRYLELGGVAENLTFSSDADPTSPSNLLEEIRGLVLRDGFDLTSVLRHVTVNTARVLKLRNKGALRVGADADVLVLGKNELEVRHLFVNGRHVVAEGKLALTPRYRENSNRRADFHG